MPEPFQHWRLQDACAQIRLLQISQGQSDEPIVCTLETFERKYPPEYVAVSYTWGDPNRLRDISINGRVLQVRHNCWYTLWQLRLHQIETYVWIDSICIDQGDNAEKAEQVRRMGSIYANASLTAACIGEGEELRNIVDWATEFQADEDPAFQVWTPDRVDLEYYLPVWRDLALLSERPYFKRLWIVQELYHSKDVVLFEAEETLPWTDLEVLFRQVAQVSSTLLTEYESSLIDLDATELARFIHFRRFRRSQGLGRTHGIDDLTGSGFTGVLLSFGRGDCLNPRDKVYGLLSLAHSKEWLSNFPIDYDKPLVNVLVDVVSRLGGEMLTENVSHLIANMLGWFNIDADSIEGRRILGISEPANDLIPAVTWAHSSEMMVPFETHLVWRLYNVPMSGHITGAHLTRLPNASESSLFLRGESNLNPGRVASAFDWRQVCLNRGRLITSPDEIFWIAGSEARAGDLIVNFDPTRDDHDEYNAVITCRPRRHTPSRLDIVGQATAFVELAASSDERAAGIPDVLVYTSSERLEILRNNMQKSLLQTQGEGRILDEQGGSISGESPPLWDDQEEPFGEQRATNPIHRNGLERYEEEYLSDHSSGTYPNYSQHTPPMRYATEDNFDLQEWEAPRWSADERLEELETYRSRVVEAQQRIMAVRQRQREQRLAAIESARRREALMYSLDHLNITNPPWTAQRQTRSGTRDRLSKRERRYLQGRILVARPCKVSVTVHMRPLDIMNLVLLRGRVTDRLKYPILTSNSGSYAELMVEDPDLDRTRTRTYLVDAFGRFQEN